jgi:hypothetical protein
MTCSGAGAEELKLQSQIKNFRPGSGLLLNIEAPAAPV